MNVSIVNSGAGNLLSVANALYLAGADPQVISDADAIAASDRIVLPGVGAAGPVLASLRQSGMAEALDEARGRGVPIFGICLGMQVMAESLNEYGDHTGLGWIPGAVGPIEDRADAACRVPHTGWAEIEPTSVAGGLIGDAKRDRFVYFCHSNCLTTDDEVVAATVDCGGPMVAAIRHENLFAVQFHPEKSHLGGERLLQAFLEWSP